LSTPPLVSVIIPCHNSAAFVQRAFSSALQQTFENTEIILVDNNSSDQTPEILSDISARHPGKVTFLREDRQGAAAARNRGLASARGMYIQFLDSDDELLQEKIESQLQTGWTMQADLVIGNYVQITGSQVKKISATRDPWAGLSSSQLGITSANLWKREAVVKAGGFNEAFSSSEEYRLMFAMLKSGACVAFHPGFLTRVYWQIESVGKSRDRDRKASIWKQIFDLRMEIREFLKEKDMFRGKVRFAWEYYMYSHLVHLKDRFPEIHDAYMPLISHRLTPWYVAMPLVSREIRRLSHRLFRTEKPI
jgi:glycosyltransferase involved in cell wall biosynthesis